MMKSILHAFLVGGAAAMLVLLSGIQTAEASHYRGGNITYENLGTCGVACGPTRANWIVIKATLTIFQRGSAHCGSVMPTTGVGGTGAAPGVVPHTQTCCNAQNRPSGCTGRWRGGVGSTFTWGAGGIPHPTLSATSVAYQPANQTGNSFVVSYMKVIDEDTQQDFLGFEIDLYRVYPPTTASTNITWGSCCWIGGVKPSVSSFSLNITAQVASGNQDPRFNSPMLVNACTNQAFSHNLNPNDPDGDKVEVIQTPTAGGADQQTPPLTISKAGVVNWARPQAGLWVVKVTAFDLNTNGTRKGASTFRDFLLNVTATCANNAPAITLTPKSRTVDVGQQACVSVRGTDTDALNTLTYRINPTLTGTSLTPTTALNPNQGNPSTFQYCWTPPASAEGTTTSISFTVSDNGTPVLSSSDTFTVTVRKGSAPTITLNPAGDTKNVDEGKCTKFRATAADKDGPITAANFGVTAPAFCTRTRISATVFELNCCPKFTDGGKTYDVVFTAKDSDGNPKTTTKTVKVVVKDVNRNPDVKDPGPQSAPEKQPYRLQIKASDPDGDKLTFAMTGLPPEAKIDPNTGEITWTPKASDNGKKFTATITVTDGKGGKTEIKVEFTVSNVNDPPVITTNPPTVGYVGEDIAYEPKVTDPDAGDKHTWTLKKGPAGATVDPNTGKVSWTPPKGEAGKDVEFEIEVCDDGTPKSCVTQKWKTTVYLKCKVDADCNPDEICVESAEKVLVCINPGCANQSPKCQSQTDFCKDSKCAENPCNGKTCQAGEYCRPTDGKCIAPCAGVKCNAGEKCVDGACVADPCATAGANGGPCAFDEVCDTSDAQNPQCVKNPCGAQSCRHGRVCSEDKCIDDPCANIQCPDPTTQRCVAGQCIDRKVCAVDIDCDGAEVCINKKCYPSGCYTNTPQCANGSERCLDAACKTDECASGTKTCAAGEFCRGLDNTCVKDCSSVSCKTGEKCENGACVADPCAGKTCASGEVCVAGNCEKDNCNASNVCRHGRVCEKTVNACADDPCAGVTCPKGAECRGGQCLPPPDCKFDNQCPGDLLCVSQVCVKPECKVDSDCSDGKVCRDGKCVDDSCKGKQCQDGEICKNGTCVGTCAGVFCPTGEICVDGKCTGDPCADKQCPAGEVCVNGTCTEDLCQKEQSPCKDGRLCKVDKCVDDPCRVVTCPQGLTCKDGQCEGDRDCKTDVDCPNGGVCIDGKCASSGCYQATCEGGKICSKGQCGDNPCDNKTCQSGEFCSPGSDSCEKVCPTCPAGEICKNGSCTSDPCKDVTCNAGERCVDGSCVKDICTEKDANTTYCRYGRVCKDNKCEDDPCANVKCANGESCLDGICVGSPTPSEGNAGEPTSSEPSGDGGNGTDQGDRIFSVAGGLACAGCSAAGNSPAGTLFFFLIGFFLLLMARRRA